MDTPLEKKLPLISIPTLHKVKYLIQDLPQKIGQVKKSEEVVFAVGDTGEGKSTTINYLIGCNITKIDGLSYSTAICKPSYEGQKIAETSNKTESVTLYPERYTNVIEHPQVVFYDCAGFKDNRGIAEKVCASIGTEFAVSSAKEAKSISVMIVISIQTLEVSRGECAKKLARTLGDLLKNPETLHESVLFVFTKCSNRSTASKKMLVEKLNEYLEKSNSEEEFKIFSLMSKNQNNIILIDVFDKGESREEIFSKIKTLKSAPKEAFDFEKYDETREKFNYTLDVIAAKGLSMINSLQSLYRKQQFDELTFNECKDKLPFYTTQILKSEEPLSAQDLIQQKSILKEKINDIQLPLARIYENINQLDESISSEREELTKINTDEELPDPYWEDSIYDERWRWFFEGKYTHTYKCFEYAPPAYIDVNSLRAVTWKTNGSFTYNKTFKDDNYCNIGYDSERGEDGNAGIKVHIKTRDLPANKLKIPNLVLSINEKVQEHNRLSQEKQRLEAERNVFSDALSTLESSTTLAKQQIMSLVNAQKANTQKHETLEKEICETRKYLKTMESSFQNYGFENLNVYLMLSENLPNKIHLDKNKSYRNNLPMIISYNKAFWLYGLDSKYNETKLTKITLSGIEKLPFSKKPFPHTVSNNLLKVLQLFLIAKDYACFTSNYLLFELINSLIQILGYYSPVTSSFSESFKLLEKPDLLGQSEIPLISENNLAMSTSLIKRTKNYEGNYECPFTGEPMSDPVLASCGDSFERVNIMKYCEGKKQTDTVNCPCCRQPIKVEFWENRALRSCIQENLKKKEINFNLLEKPLETMTEKDVQNLSNILTSKLEETNKKIAQMEQRKQSFVEKLTEKETKSIINSHPPVFSSLPKEPDQKTNIAIEIPEISNTDIKSPNLKL